MLEILPIEQLVPASLFLQAARGEGVVYSSPHWRYNSRRRV